MWLDGTSWELRVLELGARDLGMFDAEFGSTRLRLMHRSRGVQSASAGMGAGSGEWATPAGPKAHMRSFLK